jgi:hypothetical protein
VAAARDRGEPHFPDDREVDQQLDREIHAAARRRRPRRPETASVSVRYFYDTEFIDNGRTIELISIGVAAEDGREYYAISTEFDPERAGSWVRKHVLPKLPSPASPLWRRGGRSEQNSRTSSGWTAMRPIELWGLGRRLRSTWCCVNCGDR